MSYVTIEDRVDRIEALYGQFLTDMAVLNKRADERNRDAEARNRDAEARTTRLEEEMREFKNEMREFKQEMRASKQDMDVKWGNLSNKLGTIIEDVLAPNLPRFAREHFGFDSILDFMIRRSRRRPDDSLKLSEFDTIVVGSTGVILGEAKSSPSVEYADEFAEKSRTFFDFFPEYHGKRLILIFGSWAIAETVEARLTDHGIYALRMGADTMELANATLIETPKAGTR